MFLGTGVTNEGFRVGGLFRLGRVCVDNAVEDALGTPGFGCKIGRDVLRVWQHLGQLLS